MVSCGDAPRIEIHWASGGSGSCFDCWAYNQAIYANLTELSWKALSEWAFLCDTLLCCQRSHVSYSEDFAVCLEITEVYSTVYRHVGMLACWHVADHLPRKPLIASFRCRFSPCPAF